MMTSRAPGKKRRGREAGNLQQVNGQPHYVYNAVSAAEVCTMLARNLSPLFPAAWRACLSNARSFYRRLPVVFLLLRW